MAACGDWAISDCHLQVVQVPVGEREREREREIDRERERVGGVLAKCCHCSCNCRDLLFWGDFLLVAGGTHGWGDWAVALFQVVFSKLSKFQWASESERELESVRCGHTYCKTANCALYVCSVLCVPQPAPRLGFFIFIFRAIAEQASVQ